MNSDVMNKVKHFLHSNHKYNRILKQLADAEEKLKNTYGIEDFDNILIDFNHQHINHTLLLMEYAYRAGTLSGNNNKIQIDKSYLCYNDVVNK